MWEPIPIDGLLGSVKAVALPRLDAQLYVWTDRGISVAPLDRKRKTTRVHASRYADRWFDPAAGKFTWPDSGPMTGECGPDDRLYHAETRREHPSGQRLEDDPETGRLLVRDAAGAVVLAVEDYPCGSASWAAAGFSECGRYLVAASPGRVRAFRFTPHGDKALPATHAAGGAADREALLAAVLAAPDDDLPRLVYADWLEEHGDPARAEFIRLQCRLAERMRTAPVPDDDPDAVRAEELADAHRERWKAETGQVRGVDWAGFRRGFPGVKALSAQTLVRMVNKLTAVAPVERAAVYFPTPGADVAALAQSQFLSRLRELSLLNPTVGRSLAPLRVVLGSPNAAGLRILWLPGTLAAGAAAGVIAGSKFLGNLEGVVFRALTLSEPGALVLARSPNLPKLAWFKCDQLTASAAAKRELRKRFPGMKL